MNHKRRKPRRQVKCAICTPNRLGNNRNNQTAQVRRERDTEPRALRGLVEDVNAKQRKGQR